MVALGSTGGRMVRASGCKQPRTKGQIEAEVTQGLIRFTRERMGRGPGDIRTRIVHDMVIVRMADVLTPAERALVQSGDTELLKQLLSRLLESGRPELDRMLQEATGCGIASMYSDLCAERGERLIVFVLSGDPESRWQ
jgi:uncharacterized protein YbcI